MPCGPDPVSRKMPLKLPRIYPITDRKISGLSHLEQTRRLIAAGSTFIQLREKELSPREFYADAMAAAQLARQQGVRVMINDRVDLAIAVNADGVHLGQDDLPPSYARRLLGDEAIIGFSTHSVEQAIVALEMPVDYIAIGPVFATQTKEDPDETVGHEGIRQVRAEIGSFPLVAIGGIKCSDVANVFAAGADSAAVISDLLRDPELTTDRYRSMMALSSA